MPEIDLDSINAQLARLRDEPTRGAAIPEGEHVVRLVATRKTRTRRGTPLTLCTFEVAEGPNAGGRIETPVWGHAEELVTGDVNRDMRFVVQVYMHQARDGRAYGRINVEAVRRCDELVVAMDPAPAPIPRMSDVIATAAEFTRCFRCVGSIGARRTIVDWLESYITAAVCPGGGLAGDVVFLSAFTYDAAIDDHQAANDRVARDRGEAPKGSLKDFDGACYAPLLTFDTDCRDEHGEPDPAGCQHAAVELVVALLELGVPPEAVTVFFSGSKGFHVTIPSMIAAALPSCDFHAVAKEFCTLVADRAGVVIDESLYRKLQPLRAPNSRHEKTGLYKVRLTLDELIDLPFEMIRCLARQPRAFEPTTGVCEPVPELASLWQQGKAAARADVARRIGAAGVGDDPAGISRTTWDYLFHGARPGSRAESHFKAAANLADFGSLDELVHALLRRPAALSGLPVGEAEAHVDSALRRAGGGWGQD